MAADPDRRASIKLMSSLKFQLRESLITYLTFPAHTHTLTGQISLYFLNDFVVSCLFEYHYKLHCNLRCLRFSADACLCFRLLFIPRLALDLFISTARTIHEQLIRLSLSLSSFSSYN